MGHPAVAAAYGAGAALTARPFWHEIATVTRHHVTSAAKQRLAVQA